MMILRKDRGRGRSGITLTEILISIMIMGIGIVSLATLFPLGLLRLRDAARASRSGLLSESAAGDLGARNLLSKASFLNLFISPWYVSSNGTLYDPWVQDTPAYGVDFYATPFGAYRGEGSFANAGGSPPTGFIAGQGLPVAYDPLWRYQTNFPIGYYLGATSEARFASGLGFVRPDPNPGSSTNPSAHGLQRLTNFKRLPAGFRSTVPEIFVSPEDVVLQSDKDSTGNNGSPIVPDLSVTDPNTALPTPVNDWRYTWMVTGQQADCTNGSMFECSIVIFENRPFGLDDPASVVVPLPNAAVTGVVSGETVVEAIFGYSRNVVGGTVGYGASASRTVLLRWPSTMPDPDVKVGSWIADVTYERNATVDNERSLADPFNNGAPAFFPYQRCDWYQVGKRTTAAPGVGFAGDPSGVSYREMSVWVTTPLRAQTLLDKATGNPYHVNAALVSPYVVNVFSRTIYTR